MQHQVRPNKVHACSKCCSDATPWARATKNVKKPPGEKGRTFRKLKMLHGVQMIFFNC